MDLGSALASMGQVALGHCGGAGAEALALRRGSRGHRRRRLGHPPRWSHSGGSELAVRLLRPVRRAVLRTAGGTADPVPGHRRRPALGAGSPAEAGERPPPPKLPPSACRGNGGRESTGQYHGELPGCRRSERRCGGQLPLYPGSGAGADPLETGLALAGLSAGGTGHGGNTCHGLAPPGDGSCTSGPRTANAVPERKCCC